MSFFTTNNFAGVNFGCPEDDSHFNTDAPVAGPSRSQDWYPDPVTKEFVDKRRSQSSGLLDVSGNQFVDPHSTYPNTYGILEKGESLRS